MTDKELEQKAIKLMNLFFSFLDDSEIEKFWEKEFEIDPEVTSELTESGEYLLAAIKKWLKDNVTTDINKHYPLGWMVDDGEIKVWSLVTGEKFPKNHAIHKSERNFIEEQITKYLTLSGQIEC